MYSNPDESDTFGEPILSVFGNSRIMPDHMMQMIRDYKSDFYELPMYDSNNIIGTNTTIEEYEDSAIDNYLSAPNNQYIPQPFDVNTLHGQWKATYNWDNSGNWVFEATFYKDGTCKLDYYIIASDVMRFSKGTYTVDDSKIILNLTYEDVTYDADMVVINKET